MSCCNIAGEVIPGCPSKVMLCACTTWPTRSVAAFGVEVRVVGLLDGERRCSRDSTCDEHRDECRLHTFILRDDCTKARRAAANRGPPMIGSHL